MTVGRRLAGWRRGALGAVGAGCRGVWNRWYDFSAGEPGEYC